MKQTILAIFAHPDDESFGPGGTLALLAHIYNVVLVYATLGENYNQNSELYAKNKEIRKQEVIKAANYLGISSLVFLHYSDGELNTKLYRFIYSDLEKLIDEYFPTMIITFEPLGLTGHIDHIVLTSIVKKLYTIKPIIKIVLYYCLLHEQAKHVDDYFTYFPTGYSPTMIDLTVDITKTWRKKLSAMNSHISQKKDQLFWNNIYKNKEKKEYFLVESKLKEVLKEYFP
jgi:LmbE family N-acetylglucosaminyl deacetylase